MLQDVHVHVQRELTVLDQPMSTVGDVAMGLEVTFLNSAVDSVGKHFLQAFVLAPSPALQSQSLSTKHCNKAQCFLALGMMPAVRDTML
jgi:hypothetical protein